MKNIKYFLVAFLSIICLASCSKSSGSKEITLNDVTIKMDGNSLSKMSQGVLSGLFSVEPNKCVITWEQPKYKAKIPMSHVKVKLPIKLNYNIEPFATLSDFAPKDFASELSHVYGFSFLNAEGEKIVPADATGSEPCIYWNYDEYAQIVDYKDLGAASCENTEGMMDFYLFATTANPGTEYELVLDWGLIVTENFMAILDEITSLSIKESYEVNSEIQWSKK